MVHLAAAPKRNFLAGIVVVGLLRVTACLCNDLWASFVASSSQPHPRAALGAYRLRTLRAPGGDRRLVARGASRGGQAASGDLSLGEAKEELLALCRTYNAEATSIGYVPQGRSGRADGAPTEEPSMELARLRREIFARAEGLAARNPTKAATDGMATRSASPLDGRYKLLFTTAADAKPAGAAGETFQVVEKGVIVNVLRFKAPSPIECIEVRLEGSVLGPLRVGLVFDKVRAIWRERQWFTMWARETEVSLPRPGSFIAEILARFTNADRESGAYFDVLFLDDRLRIHRTKEGNLFVQTRMPPDGEDI